MTAIPGVDVEELLARELYEDAARVPLPAVEWDALTRAQQQEWRDRANEGVRPKVPSWVTLVDWL